MRLFAEHLAKTAGRKIIAEFYRLHRQDIRFKTRREVVTKADLIAEKIILSAIRKKFPDHSILSEESGWDKHKRSPYLWIVDPLDGTTNFSYHNPLFAVSIALLRDGQIVLGVIYVPFLDIMISAEQGKGARWNGKPIHVSAKQQIAKSFLTFCHGNSKQDLRRGLAAYHRVKQKFFDVRQLGSAAMEMAWVGAGYVDGYFSPGARSWDVAAGVLIVREAGGIVTDFKGRPWTIESQEIVASNKTIHPFILKHLRDL